MSARTKRSLALLALLLLTPLLACDSRVAGVTGVLASNTPGLSGLALTEGALTPTFSATVTAYSAVVPNTTTSVSVIPTVSRTGLTVLVNGAEVASGEASAPVSLVVGANAIAVEVRNTAGTARTYSVNVRRSG